MRIVLKEMKKILTIKNVIVLLIFTLFIFAFLLDTNTYFSDKYLFTSIYANDYAVDLYKELVSRVGPSLSPNEMSVLDEIEEEQYKILDVEVQKYDALKEIGITTYKELVEKADLFNSANKTDFENTDEEERTRINICKGYYARIGMINYSDESSVSDVSEESVKAKMWIADIKQLKNDLPFNWSEEDLNNRLSGVKASLIENYREFYTRDDYSLLCPEAISNSFGDLGIISIWLTICCMFLVLPYQVREKQSRITDLKFASKVGRSLYIKQWLAVLGSCMLVALINLFLYAVCFYLAGYADFLSCSNATISNGLYLVEMSFGMHLFIYALLIIVFTAVVGTLFFLLSEANSYVEALTMGVPCGILLIVIAVWLFSTLFSYGLFSRETNIKLDIMFLEVWVILVMALMVMSILRIFIKKNLHMDVEEQ